MPAYNAAAHIAEAVTSALRQTRPPDEIIVVDDGSTDETPRILQQFGPPVVCIHQQNRGPSAARNRGIEKATGDWIALLDADDLWSLRKLELQCAAIERVKNAALVYTSHSALREGRLETIPVPGDDRIAAVLREQAPFQPSSVMLRRDLLLDIGGFNESIRPEDWELWVRLARRGVRFVCVPEPLLIYRDIPSSRSHKAYAVLENASRFVRERLNSDLPPARRWIKTRRVISRLQSEAAIVLREQGNSKCVGMIMKSLRTWPFPLTWTDRRYKLALYMLFRSRNPAPNHTADMVKGAGNVN